MSTPEISPSRLEKGLQYETNNGATLNNLPASRACSQQFCRDDGINQPHFPQDHNLSSGIAAGQGQAYIYTHCHLPDPACHIRVLTLEPLESGSPPDSPLIGRLHVKAWKDSPRFAALSYVWGQTSNLPCDIITIHVGNNDSVGLRITPNCRQALSALRKRYGRLCIWVDSICINQADETEKGKQLLLMGEIYTWAEIVYAWLGPGDPDTNRVMDWLSHAAKFVIFRELVDASCHPDALVRLAARRRAWRKLWYAIYRRWLENWDVYRQTKTLIYRLRSSPAPDFDLKPAVLRKRFPHEEIAKIFNKAYFERGWTYQELILASNITLVFGDRAMAWDTFVCGVQHQRPGLPGRAEKRAEREKEHDSSGHLVPLGLAGFIQTWLNVERPSSWNGNIVRLHDRNSFNEHQLRTLEDMRTGLRLTIYGGLFFGPFLKSLLIMLFISVIIGVVVHVGSRSQHATQPNAWSTQTITSIQPISSITPILALMSVPSISVPSINIPSFSVPSISVPSINIPSFSVPSIPSITFAPNPSFTVAPVPPVVPVAPVSPVPPVEPPASYFTSSPSTFYPPSTQILDIGLAILSLIISVLLGCYYLYQEYNFHGRIPDDDKTIQTRSINCGVASLTVERFDKRLSRSTITQGILQAIRERKLSNPKDRAYAFYGVLHHLGVRLSAANYAKKKSQIYQELFRDLVLWKTSFVCALLDAGDHALPDAPSWVPDWDTASERSWSRSEYICNDHITGSEPRIKIRNNELVVMGRFVGSVQSVLGDINHLEKDNYGLSSSLDEVDNFIKAATPWIIWVTSAQLYPNKWHCPGDTLAAGTPIKDVEGFNIAQEILGDVEDQGKAGTQLSKDIQVRLRDYLKRNASLFGKISSYIPKFYNTLGRKGVFFTASLEGNLTEERDISGFGARTASKGDAIALIYGLGLPVILRPIDVANGGRKYKVVGPAIVRGLMSDQVGEKSDSSLTQIVLV